MNTLRPIVALVALGLALLGAGVALAVTTPGHEIELVRVVRADEGARVELVTETTPAELVGLVCSVRAEADNNSSRHPGNDLVVSSGAGSVVLAGVEDEPGATTTAAGELTLGPTITIVLVMGADEVFSADLLVVFECAPPPTTTTSTTSSTTSTTSSTTTTEPHVDTTTTSSTTTTTTSSPPPPTTTITIPPAPPPTPTPCDFDDTTTIPPCPILTG